MKLLKKGRGGEDRVTFSSYTQREEALERLRKDMVEMAMERGSFTHEDVLALSQLLDKMIVTKTKELIKE